MGSKEFISEKVITFVCLGLLLFLIGCTPGGEQVVVERGTPTPEPAESSTCTGGPDINTPEDVGCYLETIEQTQVQWINGETAVLFPPTDEKDNWAGAAILYNPKTNSMLVLDEFGDVIPQASVFRTRPGLAVFEALSWDDELVAGVKTQVQERWQTTPTNRPEIRLATAWQDGRTTIFLVSIAGLAINDARFYCPSQRWVFGEIEIHIEADCVIHEPGAPVSHFFFQSHEIEKEETQEVQLFLEGEPSNVVLVSQGELSTESAVYLAALELLGRTSYVIKGETAAGFDANIELPTDRISPDLYQSFLDANETPISLRFLFQNSDAYFIQPGEVIERDYLPADNLQENCAYFRREYPGLNGVITLSQIGLSDDGLMALVHLTVECGTADIEGTYYFLEKTGDSWQVIGTYQSRL